MKKMTPLSLLLSVMLLTTACAGSGSSENTSDINIAPYPQAPASNSGAYKLAQGEAGVALEGFSLNDKEIVIQYSEHVDAEFNTEEYKTIVENRFLSSQANPLSTFAADVDTASYANIRRMLNAGEVPPADSVRIEEMINYFKYDYPDPVSGEPFSVTAQIGPCPWNANTRLLMLGLKAPDVQMENLPSSNLVFLIDVSGSMSTPEKLPLVQRAFLLLCETLTEKDTVSIVTYASSDEVVLNGVNGSRKDVIMSAIENLTSGGSTAGSKGIETAYSIAKKHFIKGGNNRVILATDGDLNVGVTSEGELTRLIEKKRKEGVFLSVMGFGTGNLKDNKMEALANNGNGNYAYIDTIDEARKVLIEEMGGTLLTVAKDVKFQVEFNPEKVTGYRLVGYENRLMASEDFNDDTKDGGEIGAGHQVTVLYEIVEPNSAQPIDGVSLKYQEVKPTGSDEWLTVNVRYKDPDGDTSRLLSYPVGDEAVTSILSDNMAFASAVAQAGMLLRDSSFKGTSSYLDLVTRLSRLSIVEKDPYRTEFLSLLKVLLGRD